MTQPVDVPRPRAGVEPPGTAYFLRVSRDRWDAMEIDNLGRPAVTVIGAWLLMAWARFGPQIAGDFQAVVRFVLVGVYGWLALSAVVIALRLIPTRATASERPVPATAEMVLANVGLAHQALVVGGFAVQLVQILPFQTISAVIAVGAVVWMGGQLLGAVASLGRCSLIQALPVAGIAWLAWLATVGVYLWDRLGHLI